MVKKPHVFFDFGFLKMPYGPVPFCHGLLVGHAQANGVSLEPLISLLGISAPSVIGAVRAGLGQSHGSILATIVNYHDPEEKNLRTEEDWNEYHQWEEIGKRAVQAGLRYQIEALVGYGVGYLVGRIG